MRESIATLYVCDPEKNQECGKRNCAYLLTKAEGGFCDATFRRECAKEYPDGTPMIYHKTRRKEPCTEN